MSSSDTDDSSSYDSSGLSSDSESDEEEEVTGISRKSSKSKAGGDETSASSDDEQVEIEGERSETRIPLRRRSSDQDRVDGERSRSISPLHRGSQFGETDTVTDDAPEKDDSEINQTRRDKVMRRNLPGAGAKNDGDRISLESQGFEWVGTRRPSRSDVWSKWGFKKFPNKKVEYDKVYCKLCGFCQKYNSTTTNMKFHLNSKHSLDGNKNSDVTQPKATQYFTSKQKISERYPKKHPLQIKSRKVLVKWICKRNRPFSIVEDPEFIEFCALLDPKFELPSRSTIARDVEATYKVEKEKMVEKLKDVPYLHGTNDGGSAINGESFLSNTVHYVDPETWQLKNVTLGCTVMKEAHTAKNYRAHVEAVEEKFGIKGKVIGYTTDNENKMHKSFERDSRNGCVAHIQSKTMQKAVDSVGCISVLRKKLRKLAKIAKFPKFKYALEKAQKSKKLPKRKVLQEVKTRFTSTLTMFHSVMSYDKESTKEDIMEKAKLNIKAINDALGEVGTKKAKKLKISDTEIDIIVATAKVLEPICEMLTMLGGDKYVTGGIVLPYMKKIVYLTKVENTDPQFIGDLKRFINQDFLQRCRENLDFDLLKRATFLDGRFKAMKSIEPIQRESLKGDILVEMEAIAVNLPVQEQPQLEDPRNRPKKKMSLESDSDEDDDTSTQNLSVKKEFENYINEPKLQEDSDPLLDFWKLKESQYPRLSVLARKYLIVQATSTPSERVFSKMGNTVSKKRGKLTPDHTDQTIFLSSVL